MGMKTSFPILGGVLSRIFPKATMNPTDGVLKFLKVLEHAAKAYKKNHGKIPVLFIDSIDMLVKHDERLFATLVEHAKKLKDNKILKLVQ